MKLQTTIYSSVILTMLFVTIAYTSLSSVLASDGENQQLMLSAVKTDNTDIAQPGEILTYSIVLTNSSAEDITVKVVDHLPNYLLPTATAPEAQANADERTITWEQINIPASDEVVIGLQAQIVDNTPHNHLIENRAEITGPNIQLTVTDTTRVEVPEGTTTPAAPIQPTAPTGTSNTVLIVSILAIIGGSFAGRKVLANLS